MKEQIIETIKQAPAKCGVYIFRDAEGSVLYVGKAKNLRNRLRSYLSSNVPHKISVMLKKAESLEMITTDTELDAFILENNLIKTHRPPFNVMLKDDKNYPYIRIALSDPYPYIEITRKVEKDGSKYYGPYVPAWAVRETIKVLTQSFPIRRCKRDLTKSRQKRPCLNYQMGKCLGPCCGMVERTTYMETVEELIRVMEGEGNSIVERLTREMEEAAERLEFERAARLRDRIFSIKRIMERQRVLLQEKADMDAIGIAHRMDTVCLSVIFIRKGMVVGEKPFIFEGATKQEALEALFRDFYRNSPSNPPQILVPEPIDPQWEKLLNIKIALPYNSETSNVLNFAASKAAERIEEFLREKREAEEILEEAQRLLKLKKPPTRIEGYDISNIMGKEAVGSMVVFEHGKPAKSQYRRFKIKQVSGIDDYAMHEEVIRRRINHGEWKRPDLILVDGGPGQLKRVHRVIEEAGWETEVIAISKGNDRDHIWTTEGEIHIPKGHPVYHLLQRIRDESHRFALSYHKRLRSRSFLEGELEQIKGVGPARRVRILNYLAEIHPRIPTPEELAKHCNIPKSLAEDVIAKLQEIWR